MNNPLAIDLFCGLGGWSEGLLAEGYEVVGFDIERHDYGDGMRYPAQLVLQDVLTIVGRQFKDAVLIVASPPCQAYSYRAMPWKRAKALPPPDNAPFDACFRIQREAIESAGRFIPLVVENVRGAQPWVGRSRWNYGSFHLWGDVPALMPIARRLAKVPGMNWSGSDKPGYKAQAFNTTCEQMLRDDSRKNDGGSWFGIAHNTTSGKGKNPDGRRRNGPRDHPGKRLDGVKQIGSGAEWFDIGISRHPSGSTKRKASSAVIAKIPLPLARHIGAYWFPTASRAEFLRS